MNQLEHLFIVRHGDYDSDYNLSEKGMDQIQGLSVSIFNYLNISKDTPLILTSSAPRAKQSAEILADKLDTQYQNHDRLWSGLDCAHKNKKIFGNFPSILNLIEEERKNTKNLILVTHNEIITGLPFLFSNKEFDKIKYFSAAVNKGEGMYLDINAKMWYHLPSGRITNDLNFS